MSTLTVEPPADRVGDLTRDLDRAATRSTLWLFAAVEALQDFRSTS